MNELLLTLLVVSKGMLTTPQHMNTAVPMTLTPSVTQQLQQLTTSQCMWMREQGRVGSWFEMSCYVNAGCLDTVCITGKRGHVNQCVIVEQTPNCS